MIIGSVSENLKSEKRVAITPDVIKKYKSLGFEVKLQISYERGGGNKSDLNIPQYLSLFYYIESETLASASIDFTTQGFDITGKLEDYIKESELLLTLISKTSESGSNLSGGCPNATGLCDRYAANMNVNRDPIHQVHYATKQAGVGGGIDEGFYTCKTNFL